MQWLEQLVELVVALPEALVGIVLALEAIGLTRRRGSVSVSAVRQALGRKPYGS